MIRLFSYQPYVHDALEASLPKAVRLSVFDVDCTYYRRSLFWEALPCCNPRSSIVRSPYLSLQSTWVVSSDCLSNADKSAGPEHPDRRLQKQAFPIVRCRLSGPLLPIYVLDVVILAGGHPFEGHNSHLLYCLQLWKYNKSIHPAVSLFKGAISGCVIKFIPFSVQP